MKMNFIFKRLIFLILLFALCSPYLFASRASSVVLTNGTIHSFERCPVKSSKQLRCNTYLQTTAYTCGPAAAMTIMNYYNKLKGSQLNRQMELTIAKEMGADENGVSTSTLSSWLGSHGFSISSGDYVSTDTIIEYIDKGRPVIVGFDSHWMVAIGYTKSSNGDSSHDQIMFSDSCCNRRIIGRDTLDSTWQDAHMLHSHCGGNGNYIVATPG